jgi:hypothetical protein
MTAEMFLRLARSAALSSMDTVLARIPNNWREHKLKHFDMTLVEIRQRAGSDDDWLDGLLATSLGTSLTLQLIDMIDDEVAK